MPIVFVHGVATRLEPRYWEDFEVRKELIRSSSGLSFANRSAFRSLSSPALPIGAGMGLSSDGAMLRCRRSGKRRLAGRVTLWRRYWASTAI